MLNAYAHHLFPTYIFLFLFIPLAHRFPFPPQATDCCCIACAIVLAIGTRQDSLHLQRTTLHSSESLKDSWPHKKPCKKAPKASKNVRARHQLVDSSWGTNALVAMVSGIAFICTSSSRTVPIVGYSSIFLRDGHLCGSKSVSATDLMYFEKT